MIKRFLLAAALALFLAPPASAHVVSAVIGAINAFASAGVVQAFVVRLGASLALSALATALMPKPRKPGIATETTTTGGDNPQTFILGRYATAGNMVAPPYSAPYGGNNANKYLTYVLDISDIPGVALSRLIVNGEYLTDLQASSGDHAMEGKFHKGKPYVFLSMYDGTQTAADPYMLATFADYPERPWSADMAGAGVAYAVVTFKHHNKLWSGLPSVRFEVDGIPLYDPRFDSTVGGAGAQRWADPATWAGTDNPAVMIYNILRGIALPGGAVWGGAVAVDDLPLDVWFAAMNACDQPVSLAGGGTEPAYRAGFEVSVEAEPAAVIEELLKSCSAEIAEVGGTYTIRVGAPDLPVYFFTDDDLSSDDPETLRPYPGLDGVHNAIQASHPAPDALWEAVDAPAIYNATWEAEDNGRRLVASVDLPAVASETQVQRLMRAWINDARRFRQHTATLPPEAAALRPLDCLGWTSARHGYSAKVFEVRDKSDDFQSVMQTVGLRERDQGDFTWVPGDHEIAVSYPSVAPVAPEDRGVDGWAVAPAQVLDASGAARRPALRLSWAVDDLSDSPTLEYKVRPVGRAELVAQGAVVDVSGGFTIVSAGILAAVEYEAAGRFVIAGRDGEWSDWKRATAGDLRLGPADLDDTVAGAVGKVGVWDEVPAAPTGLALSTALAGDGAAQFARITASYIAADHAVAYDLGVTEAAGNEVLLHSGAAALTFDAVKGLSYSVRVRGVSPVGIPGPWSAPVVITAAVDAVPPATPTGVAVQGVFGGVWIEWAKNTEADLSHYEIKETTTSTPPLPTASADFSAGGTAMARNGLDRGVTRWYWVRAVDTSGNASGWSVGASATTADPGITSEDISGLVDATAFAQGVTAPEIVSSLPGTDNFEGRLVYLTGDGKLYRYHSGAWTKAVDGGDLVQDSVTTGALAAAAVATEQLAAQAVVASKMGIMSMDNLFAGGEFEEGSLDQVAATDAAVLIGTGITGGKALRIIKDTPAVNGIANLKVSGAVPVTPGEWYWLEVGVRAVGVAANDALTVSAQWYDSSRAWISQSNIVVGGDLATTWQTVTGKVQAPSNAAYAAWKIVNRGTQTVADEIKIDRVVLRRANAAQLIVDGSLKASQIDTDDLVAALAIIDTAYIKDANISGQISAAKLLAGTALAGTITVDGTALSTIDTRAADPAARINSKATQIDPGKITIYGATTLGDWRHVGDYTKIDGGNLAANTIEAVSATIGMRGAQFNGVAFEADAGGTADLLSWSAGSVKYIKDDGSDGYASIAAGSYAHNSPGSRRYIMWTQGGTSLWVSDSAAALTWPDSVVVAVYRGGSDLTVEYGRTIIDGDHIKTGTVEASHIKAGSITADEINAGSATFDDIVVRSWLQDDSVSDVEFDYTAAAYQAPSNAYETVAVVTLGRALAANEVVHLGGYGLFQGVQYTTPTETLVQPTEVRVQYAVMIDGVWTDFENMETTFGQREPSATTTTYEPIIWGHSISGVWGNVKIRMRVDGRLNGWVAKKYGVQIRSVMR